MLYLEVDHPEIYDAFVQGNVSVQLNEDNTFGMETDKVIETTTNKDTKTPDGTTGFCTDSNAINRSMAVECIVQSEIALLLS